MDTNTQMAINHTIVDTATHVMVCLELHKSKIVEVL